MYRVGTFEDGKDVEEWLNDQLEQGYVFEGIAGKLSLLRVVVVYHPIKARKIYARRFDGHQDTDHQEDRIVSELSAVV